MIPNEHNLLILPMVMILFVTWVWIIVLYFKLRNTWHRYGCFLYALSFVFVYISLHEIKPSPGHGGWLWLALTLQLAANISFIYNFYHSRTSNERNDS